MRIYTKMKGEIRPFAGRGAGSGLLRLIVRGGLFGLVRTRLAPQPLPQPDGNRRTDGGRAEPVTMARNLAQADEFIAMLGRRTA